MHFANSTAVSALCVLTIACNNTVYTGGVPGGAGETSSSTTRANQGRSGGAVGSSYQATTTSNGPDFTNGGTSARQTTASASNAGDPQMISASGGSSTSAVSVVPESGTSPLNTVPSGGTTATGGATSGGGTIATSTAAGEGGSSTTVGGTAGTSLSGGSSAIAGGTTATGGKSTTGGASPTGGTAARGGTTARGGTSGAGGSSGCNQSLNFGSKRQVIQSTGTSSEMSISAAADGLSAIVGIKANGASNYDLRRYTRSATTEIFGNPVNILGSANINTTGNEYYGRLNRSGLKLYFTRGTPSSSAIYVSSRVAREDELGTSTLLDSNINETGGRGAWAPFVPGDDSYLYFVAETTNGAPKVHRAEITSTGFGTQLELAIVNSIGNVNTVAVTDDQLTLYVSARGANSFEQIWKATRSTSSDHWSTPLELPDLREAINTYVADVSPDGCTIYYAKASADVYHLWQADKGR